jgi:S-adenosylmethionine uptake transporter
MFHSSSLAVRGFLIALLGYSIYSFSDAIMKSLSDYPLPVRLGFSAICATFSVYVVTCFRTQSLWSDTLRPQNQWVHFVRAVFILITHFLFFKAMARMPLAEFYGLIYLIPLLVMLASIYFLKETAPQKNFIALILGFVGALFIIQPGYQAVPWAAIWPVLVGVVLVTFNNILVRKYGQHETGSSFALTSMALVAFCFFPFVVRDFHLLDIVAILKLAAVGFLAGMAMSLTTEAMRITPAGIATKAVYVQVLWGIIFGLLFFDDVPNLWMMIGVAMIVGAGFMIVRKNKAPT